MEPAVPKRGPRRRIRVSRWKRPWIRSLIFGGAVVILTLHAAALAGAALLLPHGFALDDIHAWSDTWLPAAAALGIAAVVVHFVFLRTSAFTVSLATAAVAGGWFAAVMVGHLVFPRSIGAERSIGPAAVAIALSTLAWATSLSRFPSLGAALLGAVVGGVEILAQRAPPPSTHPAGGAFADVQGEPTKDDASSGQVSFPCGKEHVRVRPLLTFESRSPDGTWTVLAPPWSFGPRRRFDAFQKDKNGFRAHYKDDGATTLMATKDVKGLDIEAVSELTEPVYSHLNAFTTIHIPFATSLSFSATGAQRFPIEPGVAGDDRDDRPAQLAYLGTDAAMHVVRSTSASGPYRELARGPLGRDEALVLEIRPKDGGGPALCRLTFKDWTSQVSTEPSPTAGWGIPQNSIQFSGHGKEALVVLTLAESGPGRGWRSVGHAAGTYKNRIRVDTIMDAQRAPAPPSPPPPR